MLHQAFDVTRSLQGQADDLGRAMWVWSLHNDDVVVPVSDRSLHTFSEEIADLTEQEINVETAKLLVAMRARFAHWLIDEYEVPITDALETSSHSLCELQWLGVNEDVIQRAVEAHGNVEWVVNPEKVHRVVEQLRSRTKVRDETIEVL